MRLRYTNLQTRILTALITVIALVMIGWAFLNYYMVRRIVTEELENRSTQAVHRLSNALELPLWSYNRETASSFILAEMAGSSIRAVVVREAEEPNGIWLAFVQGTEGPRETSSPEELEEVRRRAYTEAEGHVIYRDMELGTIQVYTDDTLARELLGFLIFLTAVLALFLGVTITITVSMMLNRIVVRPVRDLLKSVRRVADGSYEPMKTPTRDDELGKLTREFETMASTVLEREEELRHSLQEKAAMLQEIHHRVGNNFQILVSLLHLQKDTLSTEAQTTLQSSHNRILSMAKVHERLYSTENLAWIDMPDYISDLASTLGTSFECRADAVDVQTVPLKVELNTAVPVGLILNELLSNALQHACDPNESKAVEVTLRRRDRDGGGSNDGREARGDKETGRGNDEVRGDNNGGTAELVVRDGGPGMPPEFRLDQTTTLGLSIAQTLVKQIHGSMTITRPDTGGTEVAVVFPLSDGAQTTI